MTLPHISPAELTPRQLAVAALIGKAKTDKQIACELEMSARRVRVHVSALAYLLRVDCSRNVRVQIAMWWREQLPGLTRWSA